MGHFIEKLLKDLFNQNGALIQIQNHHQISNRTVIAIQICRCQNLIQFVGPYRLNLVWFESNNE